MLSLVVVNEIIITSAQPDVHNFVQTFSFRRTWLSPPEVEQLLQVVFGGDELMVGADLVIGHRERGGVLEVLDVLGPDEPGLAGLRRREVEIQGRAHDPINHVPDDLQELQERDLVGGDLLIGAAILAEGAHGQDHRLAEDRVDQFFGGALDRPVLDQVRDPVLLPVEGPVFTPAAEEGLFVPGGRVAEVFPDHRSEGLLQSLRLRPEVQGQEDRVVRDGREVIGRVVQDELFQVLVHVLYSFCLTAEVAVYGIIIPSPG